MEETDAARHKILVKYKRAQFCEIVEVLELELPENLKKGELIEAIMLYVSPEK